MPPPYRLHATTLRIEDRGFTVAVPADADQVIDDAIQLGIDPYWGIVWNASVQMAAAVLQHHWTGDQRVLELGCGVGVVGLAALAVGLRVTFTDMIPEAVDLSKENATRNHFAADGFVLDWNAPPAIEPFPWLFGCDLVYDSASHTPLLNTAERLLAADGQFWLGDPGRATLPKFVKRAESRGWRVQARVGQRWSEPLFRAGGQQLLMLQRRN